MHYRLFFLGRSATVIAALLIPAVAPTASRAAAVVDYSAQIQPIFRASCYSCHQGEKAAAGLHLDLKSSALSGGVSGKAILPGNSRDSLILKRLTAADPRVRMPFGGTPLAPEKIEAIRAWIDEGAHWPDDAVVAKHWAYVKPARPPVPQVKNAAWVRNPIDSFVLAKLEKEGLAPSPEASKEMLIRRVSLDLTGLPPTIQDIDRFLNDRSPDAYDKLVDRLLASPHYGERWATPWLDLARYADTNGYEKDATRTMWKYRDWVIQALNRDMPYDEFTIEQIAGDMLPNPTEAQRIATGFHRNTMFNEEGGVDREDFHWQYLVDRVNTTATVWLGTTLGCAQCHDHKFDPFTQKDYYRFQAFFNNSEMGSDEDGGFIESSISLPTPQQEAGRKKLADEIEELQKKITTSTPELAREQEAWEQSVKAAGKNWVTLTPSAMKAPAGTKLTLEADGSILASGANPNTETYVFETKTDLRGITGIRLEALPDASLPRGGPGRDTYGNFFVKGFEVEAAPAASPERSEPVVFQEIIADNGKIKEKKSSQLWTVDASREDQRLPRQIVFLTAKSFGSGETVLRISIRQESEFNGQNIGRFRLSATSAQDPGTIVTVSHKLRPVLSLAPAERTEEQKKDLAAYYLSTAPSLKQARLRLADARKELDQLGIASALVMRDRPTFDRLSANIRVRGNFLSKGDLVYANVPAVLPPLPENALPNRLGLARWLVSKENPLTARVAVNRFWEQLFGRGIVETSEDFGTQGARPTHPELLDWLAVEFMEPSIRPAPGLPLPAPWSMKAIQRLIVTSATYRQSSRVTKELEERDPYNKLLARSSRFRLDAEEIRDVALAASGLLSARVGGPSVFPPQPEGVWDMPYSDEKWVTSTGEDRYRRALYTFLRRTAPYPSLINFDATSREICTVRRVRTNTPLQALTTLNDPAFFEAALALAGRVTAGGSDARSRATLAFRLCTARAPSPGELDRLLSFETRERNYFGEHPAEAQKMTGSSDTNLAAWTMLSNVLLNLDETVTRE